MDLSLYIRDIPDFPKPGIVFKDITPLLGDHGALTHAIDQIAARFRDHSITKVVGIESRGFLFGPGIAMKLGCGFAPMRKPGKLPHKVIKRSYELEYGTDTLEIHEDALCATDKVLIVDDLLATGGTLAAAVELCQDLSADVTAASCIVELAFLGGAEKVNCPVDCLLTYS